MIHLIKSLANNVKKILPSNVASNFSLIKPPIPKLSIEEFESLKPGNLARKNEFAFGRFCFREAAKLVSNLEITNLTRSDSGIPRWPDNLSGSISHKGKICGAIAALKKNSLSLGLDIECVKSGDRDILPSICTKFEQTEMLQVDKLDLDTLSNLQLSAKESFYKYQWPVFKLPLRFQDIEVDFNYKNKTFNIIPKTKFLKRINLAEINTVGIYEISGGYVVCIVLSK